LFPKTHEVLNINLSQRNYQSDINDIENYREGEGSRISRKYIRKSPPGWWRVHLAPKKSMEWAVMACLPWSVIGWAQSWVASSLGKQCHPEDSSGSWPLNINPQSRILRYYIFVMTIHSMIFLTFIPFLVKPSQLYIGSKITQPFPLQMSILYSCFKCCVDRNCFSRPRKHYYMGSLAFILQ
jgi:hypothetical protein